ncbi:MAG: hypothetical protein OEW39_15070 [Deltaproteobacteria bacterium]|nr:hypothetical protein [Deltaproteobacteria bacterium]
MADTQNLLLSETVGEDTATQLYRDPEGFHLLVILALPQAGGEKTLPENAPRIWQRRRIGKAEAQAHYHAPAALRHLPPESAFPG